MPPTQPHPKSPKPSPTAKYQVKLEDNPSGCFPMTTNLRRAAPAAQLLFECKE